MVRPVWLPVVIFLILALTPVFAAFTGDTYVLGLIGRVMIFAIAALALDLLVGYGALVSFGHAAFIGLGAYAVGILTASTRRCSRCRSRWPSRPCSPLSRASSACAPRASTSS